MGLFKTKEPREIKETDSTLVKLWYGKRSHAAIVLGAYLIFFAFILILFGASSKSTNEKDNKVDASYLLTSLDNEKVKYNFLYKDNTDIYLFTGSKIENNIEGSISNSGKTREIIVNDGECSLKNEEKDITSCPNINYYYFDLDYINTLIKDIKAVEYKTDKCFKYVINERLTVNLYYNSSKKLSKIVVISPTDMYELNYVVITEDN